MHRSRLQALPDHQTDFRPLVRTRDAHDPAAQFAVAVELLIGEMKRVRRTPDVGAGTFDREPAVVEGPGAGTPVDVGADPAVGRRGLRSRDRGAQHQACGECDQTMEKDVERTSMMCHENSPCWYPISLFGP